MSNSVFLTFNGITAEIPQDEDGRYSLNDLHKAAGGEDRHKPANFMRNDGVKQFIDLLKAEDSNCSEVSTLPIRQTAGRYGGSWVSKDLVYEYAAWISPEFRFKVYRTFEALAAGNTQQAQLLANSVATHQSLIDETRELDAQLPAAIKEWNENQPKVRGPQVYALVRRELLQKPTAGLTTADIKKESSHDTYFTWLMDKYPEAVGVYNATLKMLLPLLKHGVDYYAIRDTLQCRGW